MAESKSAYFSFEINAHSEKIAKFDPLSANRLTPYSECPRAGDECTSVTKHFFRCLFQLTFVDCF